MGACTHHVTDRKQTAKMGASTHPTPTSYYKLILFETMTTARSLLRPAKIRARVVGKLLWLGLICLATSAPSAAQGPPVHWQHQSAMPPGAIGSRRLERGGPLSGYFQPVEIRGPQGLRIALAGEEGFEPAEVTSTKVGLLVAPVYRLRVTHIPQHPGAELYPTVEIIDRLYPPAGQARRFPIPIHLTQEDLRLALDGRFVTRVIYVEDPAMAVPVADGGKQQRWFDARPSDDLLGVADGLGRPVAILRIGSRVPEEGDGDRCFRYGTPPFQQYETETENRARKIGVVTE